MVSLSKNLVFYWTFNEKYLGAEERQRRLIEILWESEGATDQETPGAEELDPFKNAACDGSNSN